MGVAKRQTLERQIVEKIDHLEIYLSDGKVVKIDKAHRKIAEDFKYWDLRGGRCRVVRYVKTEYGTAREEYYLHHLILRKSSAFEVDHINRDPLDNRSSNLRYASHRQNSLNRNKWSCGSKYSTKFIGVRKAKSVKSQKWQAYITCNKTRKQKHLGTFDSDVEAAKARDDAALQQFGSFAVLNFPDDKLRKI